MVKFSLIPLFIMSCIDVHSQKHADTYELFASAGLLTNHGDGHYADDHKNKLGYSFGAGATHDFSSISSLKLRLSWDEKGFSAKETFSLGNGSQVVSDNVNKTIKYLTITALPTFYINSRRKISVGVGIFYGILIKSHDTFVRIAQPGNVLINSQGKSTNGSTNDMGLALNAGYSFNIQKKVFQIQLTENYGVVHYTESFGYSIKRSLVNHDFLSTKKMI